MASNASTLARGETGAVGEHRRRQSRLANRLHLLDEALVGGGLVVIDHEHRFDGVAPGGELAHDVAVELHRHEVRLARRHRHGAEVARLVAHRVRFERDVLEVETARLVDRRRHQPALPAEPIADLGRELVRRDGAGQQRPQLGVAGLGFTQGPIGERVVDAVAADVQVGATLQRFGCRRSLAGDRQQGRPVHRFLSRVLGSRMAASQRWGGRMSPKT